MMPLPSAAQLNDDEAPVISKLNEGLMTSKKQKSDQLLEKAESK